VSQVYEFRKLYADVVDDRGSVAVLYLTYVRLAGIWTGRASVELHTPDGKRMLMHATEPAALIDPDAALTDVPREVSLPDGVFRLELEPTLGAWQPARPPPADALQWRVKAARTRAVARWPGGELSGIGYVDWVHITKPTRLLGLHELLWGRAHLPDRTVVFEHLTTVRGDRWDVGIEWRLDEAAPRTLSGPVRLDAGGRGVIPLTGQSLELAPDRVLHDGNAFDPERVPRLVDRVACEALGGRTTETRWLGRARLGRVVAPCLYERVRFGETAPASGV
jgi:hypothetical protein